MKPITPGPSSKAYGKVETAKLAKPADAHASIKLQQLLAQLSQRARLNQVPDCRCWLICMEWKKTRYAARSKQHI